MNLRNFPSIKARREALEKETQVSLVNIGASSTDEATAATHNCENMIGAVSVPVGIAGPLPIKHINSDKISKYYIPLATTEGALVASVNRGCKAITQSGGATVDSYRVGTTRGPVFAVDNLAHGDKLNIFLEEQLPKLQEIAKTTSGHLTLKRVFSRGLGQYRFVRFVFDTQDAMGMNMATIATQALAEHIERATKARCIAVAGNYDVDKKPAYLNAIEGRGTKIWAEVSLTAEVLKTVLKTTAPAIYEVWLAKCLIGSAMAGSMGFNAHYANVAAAIFLATGQDPAHVVEASLGITTARVEGSGLYLSIYLPDLMVGTVGGGTGLATQHEALSLLGVAGGPSAGGGGKNAQKLAEIIGAAVLAGEVSLLASLAQGSLAGAHNRLARGGK